MSKRYLKEVLCNKKTLKNFLINLFFWSILSFILVFLGESFNRGSIEKGLDFLTNQKSLFILNYLIFLTITSVAFLFKKTRVFYILASTIIFGGYIASGLIIGFRGTPLIWADIFSFKEGFAIAKNYLNLNLLKYAALALVIIIAILVLLWFSERYKSRNKIINPYGFIILPLSILFIGVFYGNIKNDIEVYRWDLQASYNRNGFIYSFLDTAAGFKVKEPSYYNRASIDEIKGGMIEEEQLASNSIKMVSAMPKKFPNIIIVQLESFMDLERINGLTFTKDPIETFKKIAKESTSGFIRVPTYGGGTVRSEFEVLTGLSTDFLPVGEIPNNNILKKQPIESLAYILNDYGYGTNVIHNYEGNFYNRDTVYPNLGFDRYISMEYMDKPNNDTWQYPEDVLNIKPIKDIIDSNEKPQFIYNVTVESHGGYASSDFENYTVDGNLSKEEKNELQCYIDKLRGVDEYIKELIRYVESSKEPTVIAMFSDHLPSLKIINDNESLLKDGDKYLADFFIWDNIGLPKENINMEAEVFSTYILEKLNMVSGVMPTFHSLYKDCENYKDFFEILQYDMIFGDKYILDNNKNKYEKTKMKMGLEEVRINNYDIEDNSLTVSGNKFNYKSKIIINGKVRETSFIDENTLKTSDIPLNIKNISVGQIGKYNKTLSTSNLLEE